MISYRIHKMASLLNVHYIYMTKYGCGGEHYMISYRIHKMASLLNVHYIYMTKYGCGGEH